MLLEHSRAYSFTYCLQASFLLQHRGWVDAAKSIWPTKSKRFTILPSTGKVCRPLTSEMAEVHWEKAACFTGTVVLTGVPQPLQWFFARSLSLDASMNFSSLFWLFVPLLWFSLLVTCCCQVPSRLFLLILDTLGESHLKALQLPVQQGGSRHRYLPVSGWTPDSPGSIRFEAWCRFILPFTQHTLKYLSFYRLCLFEINYI